MPALIFHPSPRAIVAYDQGRAIEAREYLAAVRHMAGRLPAQGHVLNLCVNRYHFAVVLGAALLKRQPLLLPPTRTPDMLLQLRQNYAGLHAVVDQPLDSPDLPQIVFEAAPTPPDASAFDIPLIDADQVAAHVFTSGSTGQPIPHTKHWGALVRDALAAGRRVRQHLARRSDNDHDPAFVVTGTVPAQHMYGFESTVLLPLLNRGAIDAAHPFYPADIASALQRTPLPRILVSTPFHLRTLLESKVATPPVALLLSATAPLAPQLASQAEVMLGAPLLEIYGSTETGQVATRRTTDDPLWHTLDDIVITEQAATTPGEPRFIASGGHVEGQMPLADVLELHSPTCFALLGRHADMVNIAGKRTSLAYLNHHLNSIPGVADGALYWPHDNAQDARALTQRPMAFVVAPALSEAALVQALRERIDPVFIPRPIYFVAQLPRNHTGKLPQQALAELAQACRAGAATQP